MIEVDVVKKDEMLAEIAPILTKIKELMQEKNFKHFYIPDQFNYDSTVDEHFEDEIWDGDLNLFAAYCHHGSWVRYTIEGIYLENDELTFDIRNHEWYDGCKEGEFLRLGRMDVNQLVELAVQYDNYDWTLPPVLEFYIQLLNRYNHEDAYIEH